jgi:hypothetical protein
MPQVSRVFIRRRQPSQLQALYDTAVADGVELKEEFVEELSSWLAEHGAAR